MTADAADEYMPAVIPDRDVLSLDLHQLIAMQQELQKILGYDFSAYTGLDRAAYVRDMVLALTHELHEALDETPWKPWAVYPPLAVANHDEYVSEIVDCVHMLLNLMIIEGVTGEEISAKFITKQAENRRRALSRYDGHWEQRPSDFCD